MSNQRTPFGWCVHLLAAFAMSTSLVACSSTSETLPPIHAGASRLEVSAFTGCDQPRQGTGKGCSTITDPERIAAVERLLNKYPDGWSTPWYGAPIHPARLEFYRGTTLVEAVGVSAVSIEREIFLSRSIGTEDRDALLALTGLSLSNLRFSDNDPIPQ